MNLPPRIPFFVGPGGAVAAAPAGLPAAGPQIWGHPQPPPPPPHHHMMPYLLQPVQRYNEEYMRMIEQRRQLENNRGASRGCIERNTFPHKFTQTKNSLGVVNPDAEADKPGKEDEDEADKCTICLCGKRFAGSKLSDSEFNRTHLIIRDPNQGELKCRA
jgi:hypothetical protein